MKNTFAILLFSVALTEFSFSQIHGGVHQSDHDAIENALNHLGFAEGVEITDIINIDSAIGNIYVHSGNITDKYHTLTGSFVFVLEIGDEEKSCRIGVFKNRNIIWLSSDSIMKDYGSTTYIARIEDLNNDGENDIIVEWGVWSMIGLRSMFIYSFNGTSGKLISKLDDDHCPAIESMTDFTYLDYNNDNVQEIIGTDIAEGDEREIKKAFSYDSVYQLDRSYTNELLHSFTPRNGAIAILRADASAIGDSLCYKYSLTNHATNIKSINEWFLSVPPGIVKPKTMPKNWYSGGISRNDIVWAVNPSKRSDIKPGDSNIVYKLNSRYLPTIVHAYIRANNGDIGDVVDTFSDSSFQLYYENALTNSFIVQTIGPRSNPIPTNPANHIDTLIGYVQTCEALHWIYSQDKSSKYLNYLQAAKDHLKEKNKDTFRRSLDLIQKEIESDRRKYLSSEAYCLLKYNIEYLQRTVPKK